MLASLLLTFREGLEAALIVGIIFSYLEQLDYHDRRRWVWAAVIIATVLSLFLAVTLHLIGAQFEGQAEYIFEGIAMLLAVVILTWMIFWMQRQAHFIKRNLENKLYLAAQQTHHWALFSIAFLAVFREGIETALFLTAVTSIGDGVSTLIGGTIGLVAAILVGWLIYTGTTRLNIRRFFDVTSIFLLIFAAGLLAHGIHELQEAGWLPILIKHVWDLKSVLNDKSTVGSLLRVLVGYNDNPSLLEVVGYLGYWTLVLTSVTWWVKRWSVAEVAPSGV